MLYVIQPLVLAAELGLFILILRMDQYSSRTLFSNLRMLRFPSRLRVPDLAKGVEALSVSGQLFVGGTLLGILIVSIAGIRGAIPTLMPQPIGGFARLILEKEIPLTEFPIEVIYLFGLGLPIAYALIIIQILWRGAESKNLLWILGAFGIGNLPSKSKH